MKIKFCDTNPVVAHALHTLFADMADVSVLNGNILTLSGDAIVSPANSYGRMDGGIDAAYVRHFGIELQRRVQAAIGSYYEDGLPVGEAITVKTGHGKVPLLISAPTMRVPGVVRDTDHAYQAMRAALRQAKKHRVETLLCPGLCTLTGHMDPYEAATQMRRAYDEFRHNGHVNLSASDLAGWFSKFLQLHANLKHTPALITAERALSVVPRESLEHVGAMVLEQIHRRLSDFEREPAAAALSDIAYVLGMGSLTQTPENVAQGVLMAHDHARRMQAYLRMCMEQFGIEPGDEAELPEAIRKLKSLAGKGELTADHDKMENAARAAAHYYGEPWDSEIGTERGYEVGSRADDGDMNGIIHVDVSNYSGDEAHDAELAAYLALVRPANIVALFDLIRAQQKELDGYKAAFAQSVGDELERIAPGGALLEAAAL